jgi:hypothetical protein
MSTAVFASGRAWVRTSLYQRLIIVRVVTAPVFAPIIIQTIIAFTIFGE